MGQKGSEKQTSFNDNLFWRCYRIERKIAAFLCVQLNFPWQAVTASIVAFTLVFITLPGVVSAESPVFFLVENNLEALHPAIGLASLPSLRAQTEIDEDVQKKAVFYGVLTQSPLREPKKVIKGIVTFYCSEPRYTDSTPFITANGTRVRFGIAASNIVRFNTRVHIPEVFGDTSFVVMDRMNPRYNHKPFFDIWVESCDEARERGVHYTNVAIY